MVMSLLCPEMKSAFALLANIPLEKFADQAKPSQAVSHYLDALLNSGVAAETERGVIYVMGNTSVGKTSLVNTFKHFIDNPTEKPIPILAQKDNALIETKVLEIYKDVNLNSDKSLVVDKQELTSNVDLISFREASQNTEEKTRKKTVEAILCGFWWTHRVPFMLLIIHELKRSLPSLLRQPGSGKDGS